MNIKMLVTFFKNLGYKRKKIKRAISEEEPGNEG